MRTKDYIEVLLENGFTYKTISNWDSKQIKMLGERFIVNEQSTTPQNTTAQTVTTTKYVVKPNSKTMVNGVEVDTTGGKTTVMPVKEEDELLEKFESKAQQGLFWAKCKNSTGKVKEKWCAMAKEFSDSTSKKQYKDMPEKKHPEKTVKKKTNEDFERYLEDKIVSMLDEHINPAMTKGQLLKALNERKESMVLKNPKKNTMFSQDEGKEMKTTKKSMGNTTEVMPTKPDTDTDKKEKEKGKDRKNPFQPKYKPAPKAETKSLPNFLTWDKLGVDLK